MPGILGTSSQLQGDRIDLIQKGITTLAAEGVGQSGSGDRIDLIQKGITTIGSTGSITDRPAGG